MPTELYTIPIDDKFIIYRPLLRLAFIGNRAMANLARQIIHNDLTLDSYDNNPAIEFLQSVGFMRPDPPAPALPDRAFRPTTAVLLLTNRCNLRCTYCYANAGVLPPADLTPELAYKAIDYVCDSAQAQGRTHFDLSFHGGGEPTLAWELIKTATTYARQKPLHCNISVVSNGVWSPAQREWILKNLNGLTISLDGGEATQDAQRPLVSGNGSFVHVMRTIKALDEARFPYGIRMTATAPWRERFPDDVRFLCDNTHCRLIQVEPAFNVQRGQHREATRQENDAFIDAFLQAFEIATRAGRSLVYSGARPFLVTQAFCTAPYGALIVNAGGKLVTCYEISSDNHLLAQVSTIGEILDTQVVVDEPARDHLLSRIEEKQATLCRDCFCRWHCAGDCYARTLVAKNGDLQVSRSRCYTNREIIKRLLLWHLAENEGVWHGQPAVQHPQIARQIQIPI